MVQLKWRENKKAWFHRQRSVFSSERAVLFCHTHVKIHWVDFLVCILLDRFINLVPNPRRPLPRTTQALHENPLTTCLIRRSRDILLLVFYLFFLMFDSVSTFCWYSGNADWETPSDEKKEEKSNSKLNLKEILLLNCKINLIFTGRIEESPRSRVFSNCGCCFNHKMLRWGLCHERRSEWCPKTNKRKISWSVLYWLLCP